MNITDYFKSLMLAAAGASLLVFVLWIMSLCSWFVVWFVFVAVLIPVAQVVINIWQEEDCVDLKDFKNALAERYKKKKTSSSSCGEDRRAKQIY